MTYKIQAWDTAGQERYQAITDGYYKGAKGVLVVYDVTKEKTFKNINTWLKRVENAADVKIVKMLIGNKIDLSNMRDITTEEGALMAEEKEMIFIETSALDNTNVTNTFHQIIEAIFKKYDGQWEVGD